MRKTLVTLAFIAAAASASPAAAAEAQAGGSGSAAEPEEKVDPMVCRRQAEAGSRVRKNRICLTRSEWAKLETATRDDWNEFRRRATFGSGR